MSDTSSDSDGQSELQKLREELRSERKKHRDEISKLKDELDEKTKVIDGERKKHRNETNKLKDELDEKDKKIDDLKKKLKKTKKGKESSDNERKKVDDFELQKVKKSNSTREAGNNKNVVRYSDSVSNYSPNSNYSEPRSYNNTVSNEFARKPYHDTHPNPPGIPSTAYARTADPHISNPKSIFDAFMPILERSVAENIPSSSSRGLIDSCASSYQSSNRNCQQQPKRITYSSCQKEQLENAFNNNNYIRGEDKSQMAAKLGVTEKQVQTWYNNRRAKAKK